MKVVFDSSSTPLPLSFPAFSFPTPLPLSSDDLNFPLGLDAINLQKSIFFDTLTNTTCL